MNGPVKLYCKCKHLEEDHRYRDSTPEELLQTFSRQNDVTVVHDPDRMQPKGYKMKNGSFISYELAFKEAVRAREELSNCAPNVFEMTCKCEVFKPDNLKYLEDLSERKTS